MYDYGKGRGHIHHSRKPGVAPPFYSVAIKKYGYMRIRIVWAAVLHYSTRIPVIVWRQRNYQRRFGFVSEHVQPSACDLVVDCIGAGEIRNSVRSRDTGHSQEIAA